MFPNVLYAGCSQNLDLNLGIATPKFAEGEKGNNDSSSGVHFHYGLRDMHETKVNMSQVEFVLCD